MKIALLKLANDPAWLIGHVEDDALRTAGWVSLRDPALWIFLQMAGMRIDGSQQLQTVVQVVPLPGSLVEVSRSHVAAMSYFAQPVPTDGDGTRTGRIKQYHAIAQLMQETVAPTRPR